MSLVLRLLAAIFISFLVLVAHADVAEDCRSYAQGARRPTIGPPSPASNMKRGIGYHCDSPAPPPPPQQQLNHRVAMPRVDGRRGRMVPIP
ncbi:hypothetical protein ACHQM5_026172 [Ranunculus cassubicifolius]